MFPSLVTHYGSESPISISSVYDVSSRHSFLALDSWFRELQTYTAPEVIKMIVGNKMDIGERGTTALNGASVIREVSREEGEKYAKSKGCLFLGEFGFSGRSWDMWCL